MEKIRCNGKIKGKACNRLLFYAENSKDKSKMIEIKCPKCGKVQKINI